MGYEGRGGFIYFSAVSFCISRSAHTFLVTCNCQPVHSNCEYILWVVDACDMLNRVQTTRILQPSCYSSLVSQLPLCRDNQQASLQAIQPMLNMEHILVARLPLSSAKYAMDTLRWGTLCYTLWCNIFYRTNYSSVRLS